MRMLFAGILWRLAVIVFAANAVILLAGLIPACGAGIPFTGKTAGFCRRARKAALIALAATTAAPSPSRTICWPTALTATG